MFLKRLQAVGFKSFADKINIPFDKGITGIVGPNGSGKSNVIDAVRWVMGEQNAKNLRGKVATDIIFSGSANRKTMAMAEVTLVFDNNDESAFCPPEYRHEPEISLTRRLYADGEREYLINRKPCRLKDIVNFFVTTGLGGRSYSMIQQGQVDRILNAKPEDVRIIIEEAAGTLVFKNRRDEALKKLLVTKENLARIEDIVKELERQQSTLKSQMEKAKLWRDLSHQLQEQELQLFSHNFHFYNDQLNVLEADVKAQTDIEIELIAQISAHEAKQTQIQAQLDAADPGLEGLREQVSIIREQIARAESIISSTDGKIDQHKRRLDDLDKEIAEDSENLRGFETQVNAASEELESAHAKVRDLQDLIESFQEQVDAVDEESLVFHQRIEDLDDELKNTNRLLENNSLRCEAINRERNKISEEMNTWQERIKLLDDDLVDAKVQLDDVGRRANDVQSGVNEEIQAKDQLKKQVDSRQIQITERSKQRDTAKEQYVEMRAKISSLQQMIAESSNINQTLTTVRQHQPDLQALNLGLLSDHISFNENANELSSSLKTSFERWTERLLVEQPEDLNELVRVCQKLSVGGFPVSVVGGRFQLTSDTKDWAEKVDAQPIKQYLKIASSSPKLETLLDRVFVIPSLEITTADLVDLPKEVVLFAGQGVLVQSTADFLIGSSDSAQGVLSRKVEVERLTIELKKIEAELAASQIDVDQMQSLQRDESIQLRELESRLQGQNKEVLEVLAELQSARQLLGHKTELKQSSVDQQAQLEKYDRKLVEELSEQGQSRISLDEERERIKKDLEALQDEASSIEDRRGEVFRVHESRKLEHAKIATRAQSLEESFKQASTQLQRLQSTLTRRYDERSRIVQEMDSIVEECSRSHNEMEYLLTRRENLEGELTSKREENHELLDNLRSVDSELKKLRDARHKIERHVAQRNVEMERLKLAIEGISQQAIEKYHLNIAEREYTVDPDFDEKKVSRDVNKLRSKIDELGAINMMAIEEYDELMRRLDFITAQREEVFNSINLLEDALEEIEETTKNRFAETFAVVNSEFQNLFPILFPGGEGRLDMNAPEDPLNTGVEIIARLPGKKPQRMTLLSGGEKALTAISLIFALLKTKPTPFCFLDEVDAPLDEANVGRYNKVLEALSDRFQFIVITHNRRTMEVLDTLFGVTMQEPGVSKIVGVDMKKDIPDHLKKAFKEEERIGASAH
jgi:chromosome segregation protein